MMRYAMVLLASLAFATAANAGCNTCVPINTEGDGTCQPTTSGWCTYTCCLWDLGAYCTMQERSYRCVDVDAQFQEMPPVYFATKLPLLMEGSALRLRLGKGIPAPQRCAATTLLTLQVRGS